MIGLLKMFGKGILYVIGFPFFVVALVLFGAVGVFLFIFQLIKSIFYFFTGRKFFPELPEDKELRLLKEKAANKAEEDSEEESPVSETPSPAQPVNYQNPTPTPRPVYAETPVTRDPIQREETPEQGSIEKAVFYDLRDESPVQHYEPEEEEIEEEDESILEEDDEDVEDDDFDDVLESKEEEEETPIQRQETIQEEEVLVREETIETSAPKEEDDIDDEDLEEYVPKGSSYYDEDEDEDTGSGVSIDYDVR